MNRFLVNKFVLPHAVVEFTIIDSFRYNLLSVIKAINKESIVYRSGVYASGFHSKS